MTQYLLPIMINHAACHQNSTFIVRHVANRKHNHPVLCRNICLQADGSGQNQRVKQLPGNRNPLVYYPNQGISSILMPFFPYIPSVTCF